MSVNQNQITVNKKLNKVLIMTILINLVLVVMKVGAGLLSNSKGLIADGIHSGSDVITTIGVLVAMYMAKKPRDEKHPYGHEKIETVVTFLLAIVLLIVGFNTGVSSFWALINKEVVQVGAFAYIAAIASIILKEFQYQITIKIANDINSDALRADAWHHRSDALSSIAALMGLIGAYLGWMRLDSIMGIVVSLIVIKVGVEILIESFHGLIDVSINETELESIKKSIMSLGEIHHINDIRTRKHGSVVFVDVKICVDPYMEIHKGHDISDKIEEIIKGKIKHLEDVIVHLDPCLVENKQNVESKKVCRNDHCKML
ncbi:cation diffusion facilitator family transporter [Alkaliphilus hydrothermalis]|uniref:Cation diffusion facilitator family transporter n=1 Tax=Alkaliphilus hydrothermalis TaxID=1482730 RepID=A0ABS2NR42_9FIRM|nr:cation diffusion facilitator family transporter [Alkaliphilus hydrothermalis]MBM7615257.1 cation diffusion facilitator family transporter [Alkaliphilus hydrothermalis]